MGLLAMLLAAVSGLGAQQPAPGETKGEAKEPAKAVVRIRCGDTVLAAIEQIGEAYRKANAKVDVGLGGGGSSVAMSALTVGVADVAIITRPATTAEAEAARTKGFEPMEQILGYEELVIVVHKDNPIASITLAQLTELWGEKGSITQWPQIGVTLPGNADPAILLVGFQAGNARHQFLKTLLLAPRGNFRRGTTDVSDAKDVVALVAKQANAVGYCPPAWVLKDRVRVVPIAANGESKATLPGDAGYPLRRPTYLYFRDEPTGNVKAFVSWLLGPAGQAAVKATGITPRSRG
ncbi:MAG: substrate-binding domain-containing protein [Planctomycetota bacterium]